MEFIQASRKMWLLSLRGLTRDQMNNGITLIASGETEFQKFPPNPQEFRNLCLHTISQDPSHVANKLLEYNHTYDRSSEAFLSFQAWRKGLRLADACK